MMREVADFVEEQRAVVRELEAAGLAIVRAGERALLVAEDFRLEQRVGQRRAVDRLELVRAAPAQLVDHPGDDFLARSGRPENQDRDVGFRGRPDPLEDDEHLLVAPDHFAEALDRRRPILVRDGRAPLEEVIELIAQHLAVGLHEAVPSPRPARRSCGRSRTSTSSRTQLSTSSRMRPNVCISVSTSKDSSGRAQRKRRIAARSGDCTSDWKRASTSAGSARRSGARRLSTFDIRDRFGLTLCGSTRSGSSRSNVSSLWRRACDGHGSARDRAAARLDHDVREEQIRFDQHRRDVRHVDRLLTSSEPPRRVVHHARRRDRHLRGEQMIAPAPAAGSEHVLTRN